MTPEQKSDLEAVAAEFSGLLDDVEKVRAQRLLDRARAHLVQCGPHEFGVAGSCGCPDGDVRVVVADLVAEVERLRGRVHEAVDECQRRYADMQSRYESLRALMREAYQRHAAEMESQGKAGWSGISGYGQATAAAIVGERDEARAECNNLVLDFADLLDTAREWRETLRDYPHPASDRVRDLVAAVDALGRVNTEAVSDGG